MTPGLTFVAGSVGRLQRGHRDGQAVTRRRRNGECQILRRFGARTRRIRNLAATTGRWTYTGMPPPRHRSPAAPIAHLPLVTAVHLLTGKLNAFSFVHQCSLGCLVFRGLGHLSRLYSGYCASISRHFMLMLMHGLQMSWGYI